jgi:ABC-type nickel/cobalt efflux system permease component RcnA
MASELAGLFLGAVSLGVVHGVEPGHGWPVAASYAMRKRRKWLHGTVAGVVIGMGHLVSSLAVVAVFFAAKSYFDLGELSWLPTVAGVLLILLGLNELRGGGHHHDHDHGGEHSHDHTHEGDHHHHDRSADHDDHHHHRDRDAPETSLASLGSFAFILGFAHEEEFEIILLCTGSNYCLELMTAYAVAVVVGIVGLTLLLVAGYYRYEERVESLSEYFPLVSAAVLVLMGLGFVFGVF